MSYQRLLEDEIARLRSLNAELLAACEALVAYANDPLDNDLFDAVDLAKPAIAKAKEPKPGESPSG